MCQTCKLDVDGVCALCEKCFALESPQHKSEHKFFRVPTEHASDMPDDRVVQSQKMWRCLECPLVSGPVFPYSHDHLNIKLSWGGALADATRPQMGYACLKNNLQFRKLREPQLPIDSRCMICNTFCAADGAWSMFCMQCALYACSKCVQGQRVTHRHPLHQVQITKAASLVGSGFRFCNTCGQRCGNGIFTGLTCVSCGEFSCCYGNCLKRRRFPREHAECQGQASAWKLRLRLDYAYKPGFHNGPIKVHHIGVQ